MGLALLKEAEDWGTSPIIPQDVSAQRYGEGMKRLVDDFARDVIRDRTHLIQLQAELRAANRDQLQSATRDDLIPVRALVVSVAIAIETAVDRVRVGFSTFQEELAALRRAHPFASSEQRRYFRKLDARMIDISGQSIGLREEFVRFLRGEHLSDIDARLRELARQQRPLDEVVTNLIRRYPTVSEYLAR